MSILLVQVWKNANPCARNSLVVATGKVIGLHQGHFLG